MRKKYIRKSGISNRGNFFSTGKKGHRVVLQRKPSYQAILLFFSPRDKGSIGYIWLNQDRIRRLRELLDRDRSDKIYINERKLNLTVEKKEDNEATMVLRNDYSAFLDYFWLYSEDVISVLKVLHSIIPTTLRQQFRGEIKVGREGHQVDLHG